MSSQILAVRVALAFGLVSSSFLTGCGSMPGSTKALSGLTMGGSIHGGIQPIVGAQVDLLAAGTSGYGTGSVSLLSNGPVLSNSSGAFSFTGKFSCPSSSAQVYVIASGGDPGGGFNPNSVLMTALGSCGDLTPSTFIAINEVSTVAAAVSLAPFMSSGSTSVGTSATNITGLTNAFKTVSNLVDLSTGSARATTVSGNGVVPKAKINALATLLAACVNTNGTSTPCSVLFTAATPPGGTQPSNTLSAIVDIALNPGNNVSSLFAAISPLSVFQPTLAVAPNDWTLSIAYNGGDLNGPLLPAVDGSGNVWVPNGSSNPGKVSLFSPTGEETTITGGGLALPFCIAIDISGNAWTANAGNSSISKHASNGSALSGSDGFSVPGPTNPEALALDSAGHVFVASSSNTVTEFDGAGSSLTQFINGGINIPYGVAVDSSQNIWTANRDGNSVSKFSNSGVALSATGFGGGGLSRPYWIAIDANDNAWIGNFADSSVTKLSSAGVPASGAGFVTPAGVTALAIDGANSVWTANRDGSISHLSNSGAALSPATGYHASGANVESGIVVDASGNVWVTDLGNVLFEYVGAAAPTVVPLQAAVKNGQLGQRP